jgi:hypothetical protein
VVDGVLQFDLGTVRGDHQSVGAAGGELASSPMLETL